MPGKIHIGTSGWNYRHWRGPFYPDDLKTDQWLEYYADHFRSVEINNSFYRLPDKATFQRWARRTPTDFCFAVKASRYITHMKKLKEDKQSLDRLVSHSDGLGKKRGPLLFQLPPNWSANPERLAEFLRQLPKKLRCTFEFRDPDWHTQEIHDLLAAHNAAFCIFEIAGFRSPVICTADFVYIRLHGPDKSKYSGSYSTQALRRWADRIRDWRDRGKDVYIFFDNDQNGYAALNAGKLQELLNMN